MPLALTVDGGSLVRHNYRQAVDEFYLWHKVERRRPPRWETLNAEDLRRYVSFLNHAQLSRAAIRLRLRALESFFSFLVRQGFMGASPFSKRRARPARGTSPAPKARRQMAPLPAARESASW